MNIVRYLGMRLKTLRGMTVVHVGAHYGEEAERYQRSMAKKVVWIEAAPDIFPRLEEHIADMRKRPPDFLARLCSAPPTEHLLAQTLVGEEDGRPAEFHLFDNAGSSNSMFRLHRGENDRFASVRETGEVLTLPMKRLDTVLDEIGVAPESVDVLVLDVQGAELICLKGADRTLKSVRYIETEVSKEPVYDGGVLLAELEPWLNARGFVRRTWLNKPHMNAIFVRR